MKKIVKRKQKKSNKLGLVYFFIFIALFGVLAIMLPVTQTNKLSYGASVPFTPVPAKPNLQLEWFLVPTGSLPATPIPQDDTYQPPSTTNSPTTSSSQPINIRQPITNPLPASSTTPASPIGDFPTGTSIAPITSNGMLCSQPDDSGEVVTGDCYCPDLTVTCTGGIGYGANGKLYPEVNPCGSKTAPGSGRYCVEKPVIYLYPTIPTLVDVAVVTSGSVVVSNPLYPLGGWKDVLAQPDGTMLYNDKEYSELFYETSVTNFQKPTLGVTIPKAQLAIKLSTLLDTVGLIGNEKQEFLSYWLPQLEKIQSSYIFFSILPPIAKAEIDTVDISPKPDTQIGFIAYFKGVSIPAENTLQLPPTPKRKGFVSVEWGGVIAK
jgi:hypothetical protein